MTTETDRELLEWAAKAFGIKVEWRHNSQAYYYDDEETGREQWHPNACDGQAFRLAVKLGIYVKHFPALEDDAMEYPGFVEAWRCGESDPIVTEYLNQRKNGEELEATRSVIVRAAAAIGKEMKP